MTIEIWLAIAAVFGPLVTAAAALGGVWLGGRNARKQQQAEFEHQERTRFHDHRSDVYAEFLGAVDRVVSGIVVDGQLDTDYAKAMLRAFWKAQLVATPDVNAKLTAVWLIVARIVSPDGEAVTETTEEEHRASIQALLSAIRSELGVADPEDDDAALAATFEALRGEQPQS